MEQFVNVCVICGAAFAFGYLCYVMLWPDRF